MTGEDGIFPVRVRHLHASIEEDAEYKKRRSEWSAFLIVSSEGYAFAVEQQPWFSGME